MELRQILTIEFLGNTIQDYTWFFGAILLGLIFKKLISKYLSSLLFKLIKNKNTDLELNTFESILIKPIALCVMLSVIFIGSSNIQYPPGWNLVSENEIGLKMFVNKALKIAITSIP